MLTETIGQARKGASPQELLQRNGADVGADSESEGPGTASVAVWLMDTFSAAMLGWTQRVQGLPA